MGQAAYRPACCHRQAHFIVAAADETGHGPFAFAGLSARHAARALLANLHQELAVFGEFQDLRVRAAIAADPDISLVVDENAVVAIGPLIALAGTAPVAQQIAGLIEFQNGRRTRAALGRLQLRALLHVRQSAGAAIDDPDVVVGIGPDSDGLSEHPMIGKRFWPHRVHFEARRLHAAFGLRGGRPVEHSLTDSECGEDCEKTGTDEEILLAFQIAHHRLPKRRKGCHETPQGAIAPHRATALRHAM